MKKLLCTTALATCIMGAGSTAALAECEIFAQDADQTRLEQRASLDTSTTRDIRRLRDAAKILNAYGKEDACETVAAALNDIADNPEESREMRRDYEARMRGDEAGEQMAEAEEPRPYDERAQERLASAKPLPQASGSLNANEMIGSDVQNGNGEDIGEVHNLILSSEAKPAYVVIAHGGFLGLGEKLVAVPFDRVRVSGDGEVFYVSMTDEQFEQAPEFDDDNFSWEESGEWRSQNDEFYANIEVNDG